MLRGRCQFLLLFLAVCLSSAAIAAAQDGSSTEAESAKRFRARAQAAVREYVVQNAPQGMRHRELKRHNEPILRWSNPLGGQRAHGEVHLWLDEGRPAAVLSLYELTRPDEVVEHHEWSSLALHGLIAKGPVAWSPKDAGIEFQAVPGSPVPAKSARVRLSQMREIAGQFSATKTTREGDVRPLRLLSQPLYRYQPGDSPEEDGALFALVEATDPELLLLVESRTDGNERAWQYAAARLTNVKLELSHRDNVVWLVETLPWSEAVDRPDKLYSAFGVR